MKKPDPRIKATVDALAFKSNIGAPEAPKHVLIVENVVVDGVWNPRTGTLDPREDGTKGRN